MGKPRKVGARPMIASVTAAVRPARLIALLVALTPAAADGREPARPTADGPGPVRDFFRPSDWLRSRDPAPVPRFDPAARLVRQEQPAPDLSVPSADRALGGGGPTIDEDQSAASTSTPASAPGDAQAGGATTDTTAGSGAPSRSTSGGASTAGGSTSRAGSLPRMPDLGQPAANRPIGAGRPTDATARAAQAEETAGKPGAVKHLQDLLGFEDSPVKVHGWIQNSYSYNANGRGKSGENFGVWPNHKADWWMGNQYYVIVEKPLKLDKTFNFGFRVDNLFGNDWQWDFIQGLFNGAFPLNSFAAYNPAQFYGEAHFPILTEGGVDVKAGRFYTIAGYEQVPAIARPLLSSPYMFTYGQPFTHVGVLTTWHVTKNINIYNGAINGWDRWINERYVWGYLGGFTWSAEDGKTTLAMTSIWGPNQFPSFLPADQELYLTGYVNIPSLAGLPNPGYWRNGRTFFTWVATRDWTDKLTHVVESDQGWERAIPGLASGGRNGAPRDATWFSFGNWFLYEFSPKVTGVWRSEIFWDPQGARAQNMVNGQFVGDRYHEITLGAIFKPNPNLWIRPEARWDWTQFHPAYTDDSRKSQFTLSVDAVIIW